MTYIELQEIKREIAQEIKYEGCYEALDQVPFSNQSRTLSLWKFIVDERNRPDILQDTDKQDMAIQEIKNLELSGWVSHDELKRKMKKANVEAKQKRLDYLKELSKLIFEFVEKTEALDKQRNQSNSIYHISELKKVATDITRGSTLSI